VTDPADAHQVQALLVDIFAQTGQKVEINDPLVAAALIHSALLRRAGQDAARAIEQAAQRARQDAERSAREQQLAADQLQRALRWLGLWQTQVMLSAVLLLFGMLAGALGAYIVLMR
jgi:predicted N-formylglutamate amidohydrolase